MINTKTFLNLLSIFHGVLLFVTSFFRIYYGFHVFYFPNERFILFFQQIPIFLISILMVLNEIIRIVNFYDYFHFYRNWLGRGLFGIVIGFFVISQSIGLVMGISLIFFSLLLIALYFLKIPISPPLLVHLHKNESEYEKINDLNESDPKQNVENELK
eukprot:TRINITY_DN5955_c0_g1_i1.p1 TRINITY_DN5955_c0_g1~~TRINITY_DN5955_c0_g1_i1.p1  ORF type:complete len:158 (-),score=35.59 TRINITY_DN5955_c0_g1_i1:68-541(-)